MAGLDKDVEKDEVVYSHKPDQSLDSDVEFSEKKKQRNEPEKMPTTDWGDKDSMKSVNRRYNAQNVRYSEYR